MASPSTTFGDRIKVYEMVRDAVSAGRFVSATDFIRSNKDCGCALPSRETVRRWAVGSKPPFSGKNLFAARPSKDLSFFLGAWLGDGWGDKNDGGKRMRLKVRSADFAKEFAHSATMILRKTKPYATWVTTDEGGPWYNVKVTSFELFDFVNKDIDELRDHVAPFPKEFLRGFFTAEGCPSVNVSRTGGLRLNVGVVVSNSYKPYMVLTESLLRELGLHPGAIRLNMAAGRQTNVAVASQSGWLLSISRLEEVQVFFETIGFADSEKQTKLGDALLLIEEYGSKNASIQWAKHYSKRGRTWVRSASFSG